MKLKKRLDNRKLEEEKSRKQQAIQLYKFATMTATKASIVSCASKR